MSDLVNLVIKQGATWSLVLRWESPLMAYAPISAISKAAPARITTAAAHGIPDGWYAWILGCKGMTQINAAHEDPLRAEERQQVTLVNTTNVDLNKVNSTNFGAYTAGGVLAWRTPYDLANFTARMQIRDSVEGTPFLLELTSANSRVAISNTLKTIAASLTAVETEAITWDRGVWDFEMVSNAVPAIVTRIAQGTVTVSKEITR